MIDRKPLAPNNRTPKGLMRELASGAFNVTATKSNNRTSIFHWARAGRQNSEGFGGGRVVGK